MFIAMNLIRLLITCSFCFLVLVSTHARTVAISEQFEMNESSLIEDPNVLAQFPLNDIMAALQVLNLPHEYLELTNSYEAPALINPQESHNLLHTNLPPPAAVL